MRKISPLLNFQNTQFMLIRCYRMAVFVIHMLSKTFNVFELDGVMANIADPGGRVNSSSPLMRVHFIHVFDPSLHTSKKEHRRATLFRKADERFYISIHMESETGWLEYRLRL
jgi:hypothetical protein